MVKNEKDEKLGWQKRRQPNHKAMDCKIILAVVHVGLSPHWCHSIVLSYFVASSAQCTSTTGPQPRERERQKRRQQHTENKGNKGMFWVASVWCYCAHLNGLSDLSLSPLPGAMLHSFAWDLLAPVQRWGWFRFWDHGASSAVACPFITACDVRYFLYRYSKKKACMHVNF